MNILKAREEILEGKTIYDMKLKVADYGRVSTDKDEQINSLENQKKYFDDYINNNKNWIHVNSYIDEGISGTQVKKREQFLKMIEDARLGKIDLIITKEVSRFARNTIDSIKYTELLLSYGVIVFFTIDNINTIYKDSEFRLTLMASMAQDEVRKLSERVKFGIKRSIKDGKLIGGSLYGYNKHKSNLTIVESEAKVVRMIYSMYSEGLYSLKRIGEILASKEIYTRKGHIFSDMTLKKMIKNPRYKGFFTANISEVEDYKTHKRIFKKENEWIIYKDKNIPSIVSEELWDKANKVLKERKNKKSIINNKKNSKYTSKIICLDHNCSYIRTASSKRNNNPVWHCNNYLRHGLKGCISPRLYEKQLDEVFSLLIEKIIKDKNKIINNMLDIYTNTIIEINNKKNDIEKEINDLKNLKTNLLDLLIRKIINEEEYSNKINKINYEIKSIKESKNDKKNDFILNIKNRIIDKLNINKNIDKFFDIFIKKVSVRKIENNRNYVKLKIEFNYEKEDYYLDLHLNNKKYLFNKNL